jgi:hypothetical protein
LDKIKIKPFNSVYFCTFDVAVIPHETQHIDFYLFQRKKNAAIKPHLREGYNTLNSGKEVCISRVVSILHSFMRN